MILAVFQENLDKNIIFFWVTILFEQISMQSTGSYNIDYYCSILQQIVSIFSKNLGRKIWFEIRFPGLCCERIYIVVFFTRYILLLFSQLYFFLTTDLYLRNRKISIIYCFVRKVRYNARERPFWLKKWLGKLAFMATTWHLSKCIADLRAKMILFKIHDTFYW